MRRKRKTLAIPLVVGLIFGIGWLYFVLFVPPDRIESIIIFFVLLFVAVFWTAGFAFANLRRGLLIACGMTIYLVLRFLQMDTGVTTVLLILLLLTVEVYFLR